MDFRKRSQSEFDGYPRRRFAVSGWFTPGLVAVLCAGLLLTAYEHSQGNLHWLHMAVTPPPPADVPTVTGPGGPPPIQLTRTKTAIGSEPEFVSVTLLPGRGLDVLQITAFIPGHGEITLLSSPPMTDVKRALTNTGKDANGRLGAMFGAPFLAPWAGDILGTPTEDGTAVQTSWNGTRLLLPSAGTGEEGDARKSMEGLLFNKVADGVKTGVIDDGQSAEAIFHLGSFGGAWPSSVDLQTNVELTGHGINLMMTARNMGNTTTPIGLGWKPHFHIAGSGRENATLLVPSTNRIVTDKATGMPSATPASVAGTALDFQRAEGTKLGTSTIDETYVNLHRAILADGPIIELRDHGSNYGLRLLPLSDSINSLHVTAPASADWIALEPDTNLPDPLGKEWTGDNPSGIHMLKPGETFSWKLRLEIFAVTGSSSTD